MTANKPLYCYDMTIPMNSIDKIELKIKLLKLCKKGGFQGERGNKTGYEHYQCRFSLKKKLRLSNLAAELKSMGVIGHITPTSNENKGNYNYITKEHTRIIDFIEINDNHYIPRQVREIKELRPFQKEILEKCNDWDTRYINYIYQPTGNVGKSILVSYMRAYKLARVLPSILKDGKDIMRMVMNMPTSKCYFFDMPKAMKKENLTGFYSAIEEIKNGYAWDDRYKFQEKVFDCPNIWIMSNTPVNLQWLSKDRWKFWTIDNNTYELKKYGMNDMVRESDNYFGFQSSKGTEIFNEGKCLIDVNDDRVAMKQGLREKAREKLFEKKYIWEYDEYEF